MFQMNGSKIQLTDILPMAILWGILSIVAFALIYKKTMKRSYSLILYSISLIVGGIILVGIPNAVMPIQQILITISMGNPIIGIIPMIIVLIVLLATTLVIGRLFCGYACPLGAVQELISKFQFKNTIKNNGKRKYVLNIPKNIRLGIRGGMFFVIVVLAIIWSINLLQLINPFLAFSFFTSPLGFVLWIPLLILGITIVASFFMYRPWCTLACPFGALANITSRFSRYKLKRTENCTDCGLCEGICPVDEAGRSDSKSECYLCNRCVDICPQNAIKFSN